MSKRVYPWDEEDEEDIWYDEGKHPKDVVACPGVTFTSLQNSCYVNIDDILDIGDEDE